MATSNTLTGIMPTLYEAMNVVSLGPAARAAEIAARYRKEWAALGRAEADLPRIGITRHVVIAATDEAARQIARRAYARWIDAMTYIWRRGGIAFPLADIYPQDWDALETIGHGVAGSPDTNRHHPWSIARLAISSTFASLMSRRGSP